jgi:hypothetical protein
MATFQLSPNGEQIAIFPFTGDKLTLIDLTTGVDKTLKTPGMPFFWSDETHLFILGDSDKQQPWRALDIVTEQTVRFVERWEYNSPKLGLFSFQLYTGWQAASALQVSNDTICNAVRSGKLHPITAADGSLLLERDELLEHGTEIVRGEYDDELLSSEEIANLLDKADSVVSVNRVWFSTPLEPGYDYGTWQRMLIVTGLPESPHDAIIYVGSEEHWLNYPTTVNQERIAGGRLQRSDTHPDFFVSADLCVQSDSDKNYILYRKSSDGKSLAPVGSIPFTEYPRYSESGRSEMVWSPDRQSIYIDEWSKGQYHIFQLILPER